MCIGIDCWTMDVVKHKISKFVVIRPTRARSHAFTRQRSEVRKTRSLTRSSFPPMSLITRRAFSSTRNLRHENPLVR